MAPETRPPKPILRIGMSKGEHASPTPDLRATSTPLDELSAATGRLDRDASHSRNRGRRPGLMLPILAALVVGAALTAIGPFVYVCAATFRIMDAADETRLASYRTKLLDYCWQHMPDPAQSGQLPGDWYVDSPHNGVLRLCVAAKDRDAGVQTVRGLARDFTDQLKSDAGTARATPSTGELILSELVAGLQARLGEAQTQLDRSVAALPPTDHKQQREDLLLRWETTRQRFTKTRHQLDAASARLAELKSQPPPTHGIVSSEDRRSGLMADSALQQDLRELEVNLTELKRYLVSVWEDSIGDLDQLMSAADQLVETTSGSNGSRLSKDRLDPRLGLAEGAGRYDSLVDTFSAAWKRDLAGVRQLAVDPQSGDLIAIHQRLRSLLSDFLYHASRYLAVLRAEVLSIGDGAEDRARLHVLESDLTRSFQTMQTAHRRFEFAAAMIEPRENFRLDAALRASRGLHRRSQQRIQLIDARLRKEAAGRARERQAEELAQAKETVEQLLPVAGRVVDDLIALQEELNVNTSDTEQFFDASLQTELARYRVQITQANLLQTEDQLSDLTAKRTSAPFEMGIELVECGVITGPVNLPNAYAPAASPRCSHYSSSASSSGGATDRPTRRRCDPSPRWGEAR